MATLTGFLTDAHGLRVPAAKVQVTNIETNVSYSSETNDEGLYRVSGIPTGTYRMVIQKSGFKTIVKQGVEVHIQDVIAVNFQLELGSMAESVTVEEGASMVNTTSAAVSTVVDQTYVKNMPLNGRSFQDLILLTPGIVTNSPQQGGGVGQSGEFSVNGQRTESNNYTVDGVSANVGAAAGQQMTLGAGPSGSVPAATALGTTQAMVSVDALREFRVQSSTYSAEYGRNPGGQFAFETKSGTNQWHGSAYDYLRNNYFDANDWFTNYFVQKGPALRQNDFGGTFGGPVDIPGLYQGKSRAFFFVSYEGLRLIAPQPAAVSYVPDAALRASAPAPLNQVLNAWPVQSPNGIDDTQHGIAQYIASWSNPSSLDSTSVRFDRVLNDRLRLFFRFGDATSMSATRGSGSSPTVNSISTYTMRTYTAGASSLLTSRLSNDLRVNYSSNGTTQRAVIDAFGGSTPLDLAQLLGLGPGSQAAVNLNLGGTFSVGFLFQQQQAGSQRQWNLVDTVGLSLGRHQFKFGVDYRRLAPFATPYDPDVTFIYFGKPAVQNNNALAFAVAQAPAYPLYTNFSVFAQDEWRVSQRLSLSLGLRWEVNPPPGVTQGLLPYAIQGSSPNTWTLAPQGTPLWQTTWYNFAPRVGVAYVLHNAPGWETVVRGGGGVFFDTGQQLGALGFNGPGFFALSSFNFGPFPSHPPIPEANPPVGPYNQVFGFGSHLQLPYTLQWNAAIEQALSKSQTLTVTYVGSHASRLLKRNAFLPTNNQNLPYVLFVENGLTADYDALQLQFQRRLSRGLTALASYGWSHCLDYGSQNFAFGYQRGNCDFDVRHNVSAAFSYDLPNRGHSGFVKAVMHHWGIDNRFTARTAFPITLGGNGLLQPDGQIYDEGLSMVPNQPVYLYGTNCAAVLQVLGQLNPGQGCPGGRAINPNAFMNTSSGLGNAPRNFVRGFGAWQMNLAIRRELPIYESLKLQFRAEAFNVFNHANFGTINSNCGGTPDTPGCANAGFGQATATLANSLGILSPLYQMGGPRSMQFALKLVF